MANLPSRHSCKQHFALPCTKRLSGRNRVPKFGLSIWERTFHDALRRLRDAVLRRGYAMRKLYVNRIYTNLTGIVSDDDRMKFAPLAAISPSGRTQLTTAFVNAIASAKSSADVAYQTQNRAAMRRSRGHRTGQRTG